MSGAAEDPTIQRNQFDRGRAVGAGQGSHHLLVTFGNGSLQHALEFGPGVPGAARTDSSDCYNDSQEYAC